MFSFFSGVSAACVHKPPADKIIYQINLKQTEINLKTTELKSISSQTKNQSQSKLASKLA